MFSTGVFRDEPLQLLSYTHESISSLALNSEAFELIREIKKPIAVMTIAGLP